jgi:hypothetical protein
MLASDRRHIKSSRDDASVPTKGVCHALSPTDAAADDWRGELVRGLVPRAHHESQRTLLVGDATGSTACAT